LDELEKLDAMELDEIKKIIALMEEHELSYFHLNREGNEIKLKRGEEPAAVYASPPAMAASPFQPVTAASEAPALATSGASSESAPSNEATGPTINSPMVGTYYRSPSPDSDAFVKVGDAVDESTTVCIIESMKVMNEIKAETSGVISKMLITDGSPVQYGEPLYELQA